MSPKNTENKQLKKTEKDGKIFYISNRRAGKKQLIEKLKESLKEQPPGRVERL